MKLRERKSAATAAAVENRISRTGYADARGTASAATTPARNETKRAKEESPSLELLNRAARLSRTNERSFFSLYFSLSSKRKEKSAGGLSLGTRRGTKKDDDAAAAARLACCKTRSTWQSSSSSSISERGRERDRSCSFYFIRALGQVKQVSGAGERWEARDSSSLSTREYSSCLGTPEQ